ncbi:unnamed protein product [Adineta ricciae]|uniref:Uncharacterized protein n=1 Tax=Adineta ricciae TaxID=249248 RepID=A0A814NW67_ADIRI|nr:unnamed protein product [Adineta ricciae]CAF1099278.1 unnamed protein product [Adineta ricciae]
MIILIFLWILFLKIVYHDDECASIVHTKSSHKYQIFSSKHHWIDSRLKLHHTTILGTHNSYHKSNRFYRYEHSDLDVQLMSGIRQIELDIHVSHKNYLVFHLQIIDDRSNCYCFNDCLLKIRRWIERNPSHYPIFLFIEIKQRLYEDFLTAFTGGIQCEHIYSLKQQILEVFSSDSLILPDFIRGHHRSIKTALKNQRNDELGGDYEYRKYGWPPISLSLGKILISIIDDRFNLFIDLIPTCKPLTNFFFICQSNLNVSYASIVSIGNPLGKEQLIMSSHINGQLTRTLIGYGGEQSFRRYIQARRYGIHIISTDFVQCKHSKLCQSTTSDFPGSTPVICNHVLAPSFCNLSINYL